MTRLTFTDPSKWIDKSARESIDALELRTDAAMFMGAALRVNTYVADLDRLSADLAIIQLRDSLKGMGVKFSRGWERLTSALLSRASAAAQKSVRTPESPRWEANPALGGSTPPLARSSRRRLWWWRPGDLRPRVACFPWIPRGVNLGPR